MRILTTIGKSLSTVSDLDAVALWLCTSHLCVNVLKSNAMLIGSCQKISLNVSVGVVALRQVNSIRYLSILQCHGLYKFIGLDSLLLAIMVHFHQLTNAM